MDEVLWRWLGTLLIMAIGKELELITCQTIDLTLYSPLGAPENCCQSIRLTADLRLPLELHEYN